jgi:hypothetical protein
VSEPIPERLVGIWQRESITLAGAPGLPSGPFETATVRWFQAWTRYADLRIPKGPPAPFCEEEAFGGRQRYTAPRLCFFHDLDRSGRLAEDAGDLAWESDDVLLETGTFEFEGHTCRYTERWRRASVRDPVVVVHEARGGDDVLEGLCIRIDDARLLLRSRGGRLCAREDRLTAEGCRTVAGLDDAGPGPEDSEPGWTLVEDRAGPGRILPASE